MTPIVIAPIHESSEQTDLSPVFGKILTDTGHDGVDKYDQLKYQLFSFEFDARTDSEKQKDN